MYFETVAGQKFGSISPVVYGYQNCECGHSYGPAVRDYYLIHYIMSGCGIYKVGDTVYHCSGGDMFIIKPSVLTYYEADAENPWNYVWIGFTADKLPFDLPPVVHLPQAQSVFSEIKATRNTYYGKGEFLLSRIWELFSMLGENKKTDVSAVSRAKSVFSSMYSSPITVSDVTDMLNVERTHFSYAFTKEVGISPKAYLTDLRMKKAKELLKSGKCNVSAAAFSVGYTDLYTFSKAFKKYFGVSPKNCNTSGL